MKKIKVKDIQVGDRFDIRSKTWIKTNNKEDILYLESLGSAIDKNGDFKDMINCIEYKKDNTTRQTYIQLTSPNNIIEVLSDKDIDLIKMIS